MVSLVAMRQPESRTEGAEEMDFTLAEGCVVCGGEMAVRMRPGSTRGYCGACGWISKPLLWRSGGKVSVLHPPLAEA